MTEHGVFKMTTVCEALKETYVDSTTTGVIGPNVAEWTPTGLAIEPAIWIVTRDAPAACIDPDN